MNKFLITLLVISIIFSSCSSIKPVQYFKLEENTEHRYMGYFVKDKNDSFYRQMEQIYGRVSQSDTVYDPYTTINKVINIDGFKAYYTMQSEDTLEVNPNIYTDNFLSCAIIRNGNTLLLAPLYKLNDLKTKHIYAFRYKIPPVLKFTDSIRIYDAGQESVITGFHKESIMIDGEKLRNCLAFKIINYYSASSATAYIWLNKNYGLVKWIRATGRIDTRVF